MNKINKLMQPHDFGRHGEVILKKVSSIPKGAKLVEKSLSIVVGHSESGHHHVLTIEKEQGMAIMMYEFEGKVYLDLPRQGSLAHQKTVEKHETQIFKPGKYVREIRQSYSYSEKVMRRVLD